MTATASASRTARERARAELTREIKEEARRQLAASGAQGLSLRAVARALGMVSSAVYRYVPSRDDLLTALINDAYDAVGATTAAAVAAAGAAAGPRAARVRARWAAACHAIRTWALAHPHEYALIYGSPVPGYQAPQATITSAIRVSRVLGGIVADAWHETGDARDRAESGGDPRPRSATRPVPPDLAAQAAIIADAIAPGVPAALIARALIAWTQLFGMVSFELFGQFVGTVDPAGEFFGYAVAQMADYIGLP